MRERQPTDLLPIAAEAMAQLWELEHERRPLDLDAKMRRLKDLSAYSLSHAEILTRREGVELFALGMFFGMIGSPKQRRRNQGRLAQLRPETMDYQGRPETIEEEIAGRKRSRPRQRDREAPTYRQRRLL
ncbi:MAG: hypothetical protein ACK2UK_06280 [Candidatus Promineifilaceae bacterium]|jgi:hypothetical protein